MIENVLFSLSFVYTSQFLKLYLEIILDSHRVIRNNTEGAHAFFTQFPPLANSFKIIVQDLYKQEIYIDTIYQAYSDLTSFTYTHLWVGISLYTVLLPVLFPVTSTSQDT